MLNYSMDRINPQVPDENELYNLINDYIIRLCEEWRDIGYSKESLTSGQFVALCMHIYGYVFKPTKNLRNNQKCVFEYNDYNLSVLCNVYLKLCNKYGVCASVYGFSKLIGANEDMIKNEFGVTWSEIVSSKTETLTSRMIDGAPVERIALANNDTGFGKMYNRQNLLDNTLIHQNISISDILKPKKIE